MWNLNSHVWVILKWYLIHSGWNLVHATQPSFKYFIRTSQFRCSQKHLFLMRTRKLLVKNIADKTLTFVLLIGLNSKEFKTEAGIRLFNILKSFFKLKAFSILKLFHVKTFCCYYNFQTYFKFPDSSSVFLTKTILISSKPALSVTKMCNIDSSSMSSFLSSAFSRIPAKYLSSN